MPDSELLSQAESASRTGKLNAVSGFALNWSAFFFIYTLSLCTLRNVLRYVLGALAIGAVMIAMHLL